MNIEKNLTDNEIIELISKYTKESIYNYALLIDGDWGSGKTYFLQKKLIPKIKEEPQLIADRKAVYISLYGISSIEALQEILYISIMSEFKEEKKIHKIAKNTMRWGHSIASHLLPENKLSIMNKVIETCTNIETCLLIFDDLERCNCNINEILGFINNFVEHSNAKVIIVANEREIGNLESTKNLELKYLVSCQLQNYTPPLDEENKSNNNSYSSLKKIIDSTNIIFNENLAYNKIKEKLIGVTIKYKVNRDEIIQNMTNGSVSNKELQKLLNSHFSKYNEFSNQLKHNNLRTYQFMLAHIILIYDVIIKELNNNKFKDEIVDEIIWYTYYSSISIKSGLLKYRWKENQLYGRVYHNDSILSQVKLMGYRFIDDYLMTEILDINLIRNTLQLREIELEEKSKIEDPLKNCEIWWELEEKEVIKYVREIIVKLQENEYNPMFYTTITLLFIQLKEERVIDTELEVAIDLMKKNIKSNEASVSLNNNKVIENKDVAIIYSQYYNELQAICNQSKNNNIEKKIKKCLESEEWGHELLNYFSEYAIKGTGITGVFCYLDIDVLVEKIKTTNSFNLSNFRYVLNDIYKYSNIGEYYLNDLDNISSFLIKVEQLDLSNFDLIKKKNIDLLKSFLKEKELLLKVYNENLDN